MGTEPAEAWTFSRRFRGYDPAEVDDYLARLAEHVQLLEGRVQSTQRTVDDQTGELMELRRRVAEDGGGQIAARLAQILSLAEDEAYAIRGRARVEEETITQTASAEAERMVAQAEERCRGLERQLDEMTATRDRLLEELRNLGGRILQTAEDYQTEVDHPVSWAVDRSLLDQAQDEPTVFDAEATGEVFPMDSLDITRDDAPTAVD
jgi:DivIVA domain-containing protein